jgi:DNA replicative helicase MCM subunit Mcm2 (Cdc46/Mcm family)
MINPFMTSKNPKKISKPEINLKQKILSRSDLFFLAISRLKKPLM